MGATSNTAAPGLRSETLAQGLVLMFALTVGQRLIGFVRGVLFCRWLSPDELGTWDLIFGFLMLGAPLFVLGIPGAFGRYVEHYRQKGQIKSFLRKTTLVSVLLAALGVGAIFAAPGFFGWLIFEDSQRTTLVMLTAVCLVVVIANNFLTELFTALRQMRVVSVLQLINSLIFAGLGLGLLAAWNADASMIVLSFAVASLVTTVLGVYVLCRTWNEMPIDHEPLGHAGLWSKLVPFAAFVWLTNLLTNLFAVADRYMIIHLSGLEPHAAAAEVGNYHSSRVVPLLIVSLAMMVGTMIVPHLTHDWEQGRRAEVSKRLNMVLKAFGFVLFAGSVATLAAGPILFGWVLAGKYDGGLHVLPWTLVYCLWFSLSLLAESYLWCAERPREACFVYFVGLVVNIALNFVLVPLWGLSGAVLATAAGNAVALAMALILNYRHGMKFDAGVLVICVLPLTLALGLTPALVAAVVVPWLALRGEWCFTAEQKDAMRAYVGKHLARIRSIWNSKSGMSKQGLPT